MTKANEATLLPVTVYSTPNCSQCNMTVRFLDKHGIRYTKVDLSESEQAMALVKDLGYTSAPVVVVPFDRPVSVRHWFGFRPDLLGELA